MVSGGFVASEYKDTSEIWTGTKWRFTTGKLPYTARDVKMAFIDNKILYLGIYKRKEQTFTLKFFFEKFIHITKYKVYLHLFLHD